MKLQLFLLISQIDAKTNCEKGYFKLSNMRKCEKILTCKDFKDISIKKTIGSGMSKNVMLAKWKGNTVIYSVPNPVYPDRIKDFQHNLKMLQSLQSRHVVQLIGFCDNAVLTEYHSTGTLGDFIVGDERYKQMNLVARMALAKRYVEIISFLHQSPDGTRAMCDSNRIKGTVKQYLVTDEGDIVINDLDDLRLIENGEMEGKVCSHPEFLYSRPDILGENFLAPEQSNVNAFILPNGEIDIDSLPTLDEKIDIYKIPAITAYILGDSPGHNTIMDMLKPIHSACLRKSPLKRPNAEVIFNAYSKVFDRL